MYTPTSLLQIFIITCIIFEKNHILKEKGKPLCSSHLWYHAKKNLKKYTKYIYVRCHSFKENPEESKNYFATYDAAPHFK